MKFKKAVSQNYPLGCRKVEFIYRIKSFNRYLCEHHALAWPRAGSLRARHKDGEPLGGPSEAVSSPGARRNSGLDNSVSRGPSVPLSKSEGRQGQREEVMTAQPGLLGFA